MIIYATSISPILVALYFYNTKSTTRIQEGTVLTFAIYIFFGILSYIATFKIIPKFKEFNLKADLFGYDINKRGTKNGEIKMFN